MRAMLFIAASLCIIIIACKHQVINPATGPGGNNDTTGNVIDTTGTSDAICFETQILPLFQSTCAKSGCHDAATHEEGFVLDSYDHIMNSEGAIEPGDPDKSEVYDVLVDGEMPPPGNTGLNNDQIRLIKRWIEEGAQNTTGCSSGCDLSVYTYSGVVSGILQTNCIGCHSGALLSGGVNLSNYNGVKTVALDGRLSGVINHDPGFPAMPQGGNKLSDCNIQQIEKWIADGAPNN